MIIIIGHCGCITETLSSFDLPLVVVNLGADQTQEQLLEIEPEPFEISFSIFNFKFSIY